MKYIKLLLNFHKIALLVPLLVILFLFDSLATVVYIAVETPLSRLVQWTEKAIRYVLKQIV